MQKDIGHLKDRYVFEDAAGIPNEGRLILRAESTKPEVYDTATVSGILVAEGKGLFDSRTAVLGHLQQGGVPSPLDRIRATKLACLSIDWIQQVTKTLETRNGQPYTLSDAHSCISGIQGAEMEIIPLADITKTADMKKRVPRDLWWKNLAMLNRTLAKKL